MSLAGSVSARRLARHGGAPTLVELLAALPGAIEGESDERRLLAAKNQLEKGLAMINKKIDQRSAVTPAIDLETSTPVSLSLSPATQALVKEVVLVDKDAHKAIPLLMDLDNALAAAQVGRPQAGVGRVHAQRRGWRSHPAPAGPRGP